MTLCLTDTVKLDSSSLSIAASTERNTAIPSCAPIPVSKPESSDSKSGAT